MPLVFNWPFNSINTALPGILIILGIGDAVHLIVEFYHFRNLGHDSKISAKKSIQVLWLPCFYTSFTTSIGFLSLALTRLVPIRQLGVLGAIGAIVAFILSVTLLPALLSYLKKIPRATQKIMSNGIITHFTHSLIPFVSLHHKAISAFAAVLLVGSLTLVSQLSVDTNYINYFKKGTKIRKDILYVDKTFQGSANIDIMLDSGVEEGIKNPEFLNQVLKFQTWLENQDEMGKASSFLDYVRKLNQSMHNDDPAFYVIPENRNLIAQYLLLYENSSPDEDLSDLKSYDGRYLRIMVKVKNLSAMRTSDLIQKIENEIKLNYSEIKMDLTGSIVMNNAQNIYTMQGVMQSFGTALVLITLCFFLLFRSVKYGIYALIPSILPILSAGAIMRLLGISLDLGTMIVGAMTIGIAVDDSIHVMNRYIQAIKNGHSVDHALTLAMTESGRAVIFTSLILVLGFSIMMLGSFTPFIYMGFFSGIIMFMALLGDLFLLPAIIILIDGKKRFHKIT